MRSNHNRILSLFLLTLVSNFASAAGPYPLLPDTPIYACDNLLLGHKQGKPLSTPVLNIFEKVVDLRYAIQANGLDQVAAKGNEGILFLPNHDGPNGPIVMARALARTMSARPVMTEGMAQGFFGKIVKFFLAGINGFLLPNPSSGGKTGSTLAASVLKEMSNALSHGDNVLLYPSGAIQAAKEEHLYNTSAVEQLVHANPNLRIVLVRERGLWGSSLSLGAENADPEKKLGAGGLLVRGLVKGISILAGNGIFFAPKRQVRLEFFEPTDFPRTGTRDEMNRYMERYYNSSEDPEKRVFVRSYFWQFWKEKVRVSEEDIDYTKSFKGHGQEIDIDLPDIDAEVAQKMLALAKSIFPGTDLTLDSNLQEAGLDSMNTVELLLAISESFDVRLADDVQFTTLRDLAKVVVDTATGAIASEPLVNVSAGWVGNASSDRTVQPLAGNTVPDLVVRKAFSQPNRVIAEDQNSGAYTYRDLVVKASAVASVLKTQDLGERVGVLLPAAAGGSVIHLATQLAGKVPVYVNFTSPPEAIVDSLNSIGVKKILTSRQTFATLAKAYDMSKYMDRMIFIDDLSKVSLFKALQVAKVQFAVGNLDAILKDARKTEQAVILFTSGSSGTPKAVGLTHKNIITNVTDVSSVLHIKESDRLLDFLPPFHSFGHMVEVLSQSLGVPTIYHPKPTDAQTLANLIQAYRPTILAGTPSFMEGIAQKAGDTKLDSVRLIFTGAEALKSFQVELFKRVFPNAEVVEGYGTTELSPVVAANPPERTKLDSVGKIMPSLQYHIVGIEDLQPVKPGESGLLMVRGDSVFPGYLNTDNANTFVQLSDGALYYNTGDVVREDEDGYIFILGRLGRFRKIKGEMISLPLIEKALTPLLDPLRPTNADGTLFAGPLFAVESAGDNAPLVLFTVVDMPLEQVQKYMRENGLTGAHSISEVRHVSEIPMLGTGKADFRTLQNRLKAEAAPL